MRIGTNHRVGLYVALSAAVSPSWMRVHGGVRGGPWVTLPKGLALVSMRIIDSGHPHRGFTLETEGEIEGNVRCWLFLSSWLFSPSTHSHHDGDAILVMCLNHTSTSQWEECNDPTSDVDENSNRASFEIWRRFDPKNWLCFFCEMFFYFSNGLHAFLASIIWFENFLEALYLQLFSCMHGPPCIRPWT